MRGGGGREPRDSFTKRQTDRDTKREIERERERGGVCSVIYSLKQCKRTSSGGNFNFYDLLVNIFVT